MFLFLFICFLVGLPIWQSFYNYNRYKKLKKEYDKLILYVKSKECPNSDSSKIQELINDNQKLKSELKEIQLKYSQLSINQNTTKYTINSETIKEPTESDISSYTIARIKYSAQEIQDMKNDFISWEFNGDKMELVLKKRIIGYVDYEPRCNYVNKGWYSPDIIEENNQCCTMKIGDAYIQVRTPKKGIVHYEEKGILNVGDIILTIECDKDKIIAFEKAQIKERILERKRKRDLEQSIMIELTDEGEIFPEANKRPPIPKDVVDAVWRRDGGKCVYCGSTENLQLDHIIPFSKGGATTVENLQLLCQKCNLQKSNKIG